VYALSGQGGQVAKLYHPSRLAGGSLEAKLAAMVAAPPPGIRAPADHWALAWPLALLRDADNAFVGFTMPAVESSRAVKWHMLANPSDRDNPPALRAWTSNFDWRYRLHAAANLADAVGSTLEAGYVPGDLSGDNVFVYRSALVTVIDVDSMQVPAPGGDTYHCTVWRDEYLAPELAGRRGALDRTVRQPASALFALAVLIYEMLMEGRHPFGGVWKPKGDRPSRLSLSAQGCFVDGPDPRLRSGPGALEPDVLPAELCALFDRAFVRGATKPASRPSCSEWKRCLHRAAAAVSTCHPRSHPYPAHLNACPWCRRATAAQASRPRPPATVARPQAPPAVTRPQAPPATSRPYVPAASATAAAAPPSVAAPYPPGVPRGVAAPNSPIQIASRSRRWELAPLALPLFFFVVSAVLVFSRSGSDTVGVFYEKIADNAPIGTCITTKQAWDGDKSAVTSVSCDQPHWGEILGYPRLAPVPSSYPGVEQVPALANFECGLLFAGRGLDPGRYAYTYTYPNRPAWNEGSGRFDNYATCAVYGRDDRPFSGQLIRADQLIRTDVSVPMSASGTPTGLCVETRGSVYRSPPSEWPMVHCERQHWGEVLAHPVLYPPSAPWPGEAAVFAAANAACRNEFTGRQLPPEYTYQAVFPGQSWWSSPPARGISATCLALRTDNQMFTGPMR
jgi:Septum formation